MALRKKISTRGPDWTAGRENENLGCEKTFSQFCKWNYIEFGEPETRGNGNHP